MKHHVFTQGRTQSVMTVADAVISHVRLTSRMPSLASWERWDLTAAVAQLQAPGSTVMPATSQLPQAPDVASLSPEAQQQATAEWEQKKQLAIQQVRGHLPGLLQPINSQMPLPWPALAGVEDCD